MVPNATPLPSSNIISNVPARLDAILVKIQSWCVLLHLLHMLPELRHRLYFSVVTSSIGMSGMAVNRCKKYSCLPSPSCMGSGQVHLTRQRVNGHFEQLRMCSVERVGCAISVHCGCHNRGMWYIFFSSHPCNHRLIHAHSINHVGWSPRPPPHHQDFTKARMNCIWC